MNFFKSISLSVMAVMVLATGAPAQAAATPAEYLSSLRSFLVTSKDRLVSIIEEAFSKTAEDFSSHQASSAVKKSVVSSIRELPAQAAAFYKAHPHVVIGVAAGAAVITALIINYKMNHKKADEKAA